MEFPSYTVTRTTATIDIDGVLDDADWKRAEEFVMSDAYTGGATPQKSTFRMVWDDSYLYLGVYFEDHDAWATYTKEDDPLWEEEVLELFIDPDGDGSTYYAPVKGRRRCVARLGFQEHQKCRIREGGRQENRHRR